MVSGFIFILHGLAAIYGFVSRKKAGGWSEGALAVAFVAIVFAVGWTIATMLTNLLFMPEFFIKWYYQHTNSFFLRTLRQELNRDTISLLILTTGEIAFYYFFFKGSDVEKAGEKKNNGDQQTS